MSGKFGVEQVKAALGACADVINIGEKVLRKKFLALVELPGPVNTLRALDLVALKAEVFELDAADKEQVQKYFNEVLDLKDDKIELKIETIVTLADQAHGLINEGFALFAKGQALVEKAKAEFA